MSEKVSTTELLQPFNYCCSCICKISAKGCSPHPSAPRGCLGRQTGGTTRLPLRKPSCTSPWSSACISIGNVQAMQGRYSETGPLTSTNSGFLRNQQGPWILSAASHHILWQEPLIQAQASMKSWGGGGARASAQLGILRFLVRSCYSGE